MFLTVNIDVSYKNDVYLFRFNDNIFSAFSPLLFIKWYSIDVVFCVIANSREHLNTLQPNCVGLRLCGFATSVPFTLLDASILVSSHSTISTTCETS